MNETTNIRDHLEAWGCPAEYAQDYEYGSVDWELQRFVKAVSSAANWYVEEDLALAAIVRARDVDALREWADSDAFVDVARETGSGNEDEDDVYVQDVRDAFRTLIDAVLSHYDVGE